MKSVIQPATQPRHFNWIVEVDNTHLRDNTLVFLHKTIGELKQEIQRLYGKHSHYRVKSRSIASENNALRLQ